MKSEQWTTYRTRFLVKAKQLSSSLSFVDHLGRQHCGRKGDYLVESSDGVLSIAPRRIFEDIYVRMSLSHQPTLSESSLPENSLSGKTIRDPKLQRQRFEPLEIEQVKLEQVKLESIQLESLKLESLSITKPKQYSWKQYGSKQQSSIR